MNRTQLIKCRTCGSSISSEANSCPKCGQPLYAPSRNHVTPNAISQDSKPRSMNGCLVAIIILVVLGILCIVPSVIMQIFIAMEKGDSNRKQNLEKRQSDKKHSTPKPSFQKLKNESEAILKLKENQINIPEADKIIENLRLISKTDRNYKEAQNLLRRLETKTRRKRVEYDAIGLEPNRILMKLRFNIYLRARLNDYYSSEYLHYTDAKKVYVRKQLYWRSVLKLKTKNSFGVYIVKDVKFYFRHSQIVLVEGL